MDKEKQKIIQEQMQSELPQLALSIMTGQAAIVPVIRKRDGARTNLLCVAVDGNETQVQVAVIAEMLSGGEGADAYEPLDKNFEPYATDNPTKPKVGRRLHGYIVDDANIIEEDGLYKGQPLWVPHFHNIVLDGFKIGELVIDTQKYDVVRVTPEDREKFPELESNNLVGIAKTYTGSKIPNNETSPSEYRIDAIILNDTQTNQVELIPM